MLKIVAQSIVDAHKVVEKIFPDKYHVLVEDCTIDLSQCGCKIFHAYEQGDEN